MDIVIMTIITIKWSVRVHIAKIPLLLIFIFRLKRGASSERSTLCIRNQYGETNWIEILWNSANFHLERVIKFFISFPNFSPIGIFNH